MKPYYNSWKESAHKEVNCLECHYEPSIQAHIKGKINGLVQVAQYLTKRYSGKPNAQVSDASCLRQGCYTKEAFIGKKSLFKNKVEFEHEKHFGKLKAEMELKCTNCHNQITNDAHIAIDKNTCYSCHDVIGHN